MYLHLKPHYNSKLKENTGQKTEALSTKQDSHMPLSIFLEEKAISFLLMVACLDETHTHLAPVSQAVIQRKAVDTQTLSYTGFASLLCSRTDTHTHKLE